MHVLHVLPRLNRAGAQISVLSLCEEARTLDPGVRMSVVTFGGADAALAHRFCEAVDRVHYFPDYRVRSIAKFTALARLIRTIGPDVVHIHVSVSDGIIALAAILAGVRCLIHSHHGIVMFNARSARAVLALFLGRFMSRFVYCHDVTVSDAIAEWLIKRKFRRERLITIPNAVDAEKFRFSREERRFLREKLDIPRDARVVVSVCNLSPVKDVVTQVETCEKLSLPSTKVFWLVAGEGAERARITAAVVRLGVGERFRLLGSRDDVPALLSAADCFVLSSLSEGQPVSILEAMASELPCVVTAPEVPEHPGIVRVPARSPQELADVITRLFQEPEQASRLGTEGRQFVVEKHGLEEHARRFARLYHECSHARTT